MARGMRLFINWDSCPIYVRRYTSYGVSTAVDAFIKKTSQVETEVCPKCGQHYCLQECRNAKICCKNCSNLGMKTKAIIDTDHKATDETCRIYQKHRNNIIGSINYS